MSVTRSACVFLIVLLFPLLALADNFQMGLAALHQKNYDAAIQFFNAALTDNPKDVRALYNRAIAYESKKDYAKAIADFSKAIEVNPTYAPAYGGRGHVYVDLK